MMGKPEDAPPEPVDGEGRIRFKRRFLRYDSEPKAEDDEEDPISVLNSILRAQEDDEECMSTDGTYQYSEGSSSLSSPEHKLTPATFLQSSADPYNPEPEQLNPRSEEIEADLIIQEPKSTIRMFKCGKCVGIFSSQKSLTIHKLQRHNANNPNNQRTRNPGPGGRLRTNVPPPEESLNNNNKDILNCNYCPRQFPNPSTLRVHMNTHTRERPFCCQYCNKRFFQSSHLTVHIRTHTGEKPYQCRFCMNTFNSPSNCRVHERTHMKGNEVFQCEECNIGFLHKSRLERHLRSRKHIHPGGIIPRIDYQQPLLHEVDLN